jgi:hypothetical protein
VLAVSSRSAHVSSTFPVAAKRGKKGEPDLDLIKQVEQVATLVLEGPARRSASFGAWGSRSGSDPRVSNLPIISLADISLQKTAKTARSGRGGPVCERAFRHAAGPHPAVPLPTRSSAKFDKTDRGNQACCPDFKLRHYLLGDFVVAPVPDALPSLIVRRGDAPARRCGGLLE